MNTKREYQAAFRRVRLHNSTKSYYGQGKKFTEEKHCALIHIWIYCLAERSFLMREYR